MDGTQSGLIMVIPAAEPVVAELRAELDHAASAGVPAHVTALFPFVKPAHLDDATLQRVGRVAARQQPFDYRFTRTGWFGDAVLFLVPQDPRPFVQLTERLWQAFPDRPPYGGRFDTIVPHLTIGDDQPTEELQRAEEQLHGFDPIEGTVDELVLMVCGTDGRWRPVERWALGTAVEVDHGRTEGRRE